MSQHQHTIDADEQLTVQYDGQRWSLTGPDKRPILEARANMIFYHSAFGRWRDLPPGKRLSADGIDSVQVRWDGGWAIGLILPPTGVWRRLVRWTDARKMPKTDDAARALSHIIGCPLEDDTMGLTSAPSPADVDPADYDPVDDSPPPAPSPADPRLVYEPPVYTVTEQPDVRLPLRLADDVSLAWGDEDRLVLTLPPPGKKRRLFQRRKIGPSIVFDRVHRMIILPEPPRNQETPVVSLDAVQGVRITGAAIHVEVNLAYRRAVLLMLDTGDVPLFDETRSVPLPPDPAVSPPLNELREEADALAGPSLVRAGAKFIAWYLGVPLAGELG